MKTKVTYLNTTSEFIENINLLNFDLIVADSNLQNLKFDNILSVSIEYLLVSEEKKILSTVETIWELFFNYDLNRNSKILFIGGGVLLDLCAFAASTYKRGVDFSLAPSTLLAMVDAAHGGKNGFNNEFGKNQIGTFSKPSNVLVCFELLNELPESIYKDGLIELIKHGLIGDKGIFNYLINSQTYHITFEVLKDGIQVKTSITEIDFLESNKRKLLNFGHTIGHLIEKDSDYEISHGQAVAIGIYYEMILSKNHLNLDDKVINQYIEFLDKIKYQNTYKFKSSKEELIARLKNDKKSRKESVEIILLNQISDPQIVELNFSEVMEVIEYE